MEVELRELALTLYDIQAVRFGEFEMKAGMKTPIYFDLRMIISYPKVMSRLARALWRLAEDTTGMSRVCGVPYTALPLATLISVENGIPMVMKRKEAKSYGTKKLIEGEFSPEDSCAIIEDVITSGSSILETVDALRKERLEVRVAYVIIDREQGGRRNLERQGIEVKSLYAISDFMRYLREAGKITEEVVEDVRNYLETTQTSSISARGMSRDDFRVKLPYGERAKLANSSLVRRLLELMERKRTNLCLAADLTNADAILQLADLVGPHIAVLKTHADIVEDFSVDDFVRRLRELATRHDFLLMEDRKFADIGNTVALQYRRGVHKIAEWADLITAHPVAGKPAIVDALRNVADVAASRSFGVGVFLVAEMSCEGALSVGDYTRCAVSMAEQTGEPIVGLVCQSNLTSRADLLQLTPGVKLSTRGDGLGQRYNDPQSVVDAGADLAVVGRGVTNASDKLAAILEYKTQLWHAYEKRVSGYRAEMDD